MRRVLIACTFLLAACGPLLVDEDGGAGGGDAGPDAGTPDGSDAGTVVDAGLPDAGCRDPSCLPCGSGGTLCPEGEACVDGACELGCEADATLCEGLLVRTCQPDGTWLPAQRCGSDALCRQDACTPVSTCSAETPACCALPRDCGQVVTPFACDECRPIVREAFCLSGACQPEPLNRLDFYLVSSAMDLSPDDQNAISSGVITIYRGWASDGRRAGCAYLLGDGSATAPHDAQDPTLNATYSKYFDFTSGTGSNVLRANILGLPEGAGQTIVFTVYEGNRATGRRLARGCAEDVTPVMDGQVLVNLTALP